MNPIPGVGDVVCVHPGIVKSGRNIGGVLLTIVRLCPVDPTRCAFADFELDATEFTGDRPIHLRLTDVDVVTNHAGRAA